MLNSIISPIPCGQSRANLGNQICCQQPWYQLGFQILLLQNIRMCVCLFFHQIFANRNLKPNFCRVRVGPKYNFIILSYPIFRDFSFVVWVNFYFVWYETFNPIDRLEIIFYKSDKLTKADGNRRSYAKFLLDRLSYILLLYHIDLQLLNRIFLIKENRLKKNIKIVPKLSLSVSICS